MLQYAAIQLNTIFSTSSLVEICLSTYIKIMESKDKDPCASVDSTLSNGKFPLLRIVKLRWDISFEYFPNLQECGILEALPKP